LPKLTFINLPEDKKQNLLGATIKEFSRVPLYDASIANIVKEAGIPRGSFYQYFEDKEDAFFFLLNDFAIKKKKIFLLILERHNGELFDSMIDFYQQFISEEENLKFLKNALLNMTYEIEATFSRMIQDQENSEKNYRSMTALLNKDNLNITDEEEVYHILQIIIAVTFRNLVEKFAKDLSYSEAISNYTTEINLLKRGLSKTSE
jgi:AcrR family transcriptional regulator